MGKKGISYILLELIQHNPKHYFSIEVFGKKIYPCARCFGLWIGYLIGFILTFPFWYGLIFIDNFTLIFLISWLFILPSILDWATAKLGIREGGNKTRFATGFLHGIGVNIYLFVLPASVLFKISTIILYITLL